MRCASIPRFGDSRACARMIRCSRLMVSQYQFPFVHYTPLTNTLWHLAQVSQYELYSSRVRDFQVRARMSHPRSDGDYGKNLESPAWKLLGTFTAQRVKGSQVFKVRGHPRGVFGNCSERTCLPGCNVLMEPVCCVLCSSA